MLLLLLLLLLLRLLYPLLQSGGQCPGSNCSSLLQLP
jgi:hypothetical protein